MTKKRRFLDYLFHLDLIELGCFFVIAWVVTGQIIDFYQSDAWFWIPISVFWWLLPILILGFLHKDFIKREVRIEKLEEVESQKQSPQ